MKTQTTRPCAYALALVIGLAYYQGLADSPAPPQPVFTVSDNGRYLFKMIPEEWPQESGSSTKNVNDFGVAYKVVANGALKEIWNVSGWFAFRVFLSDDGEHLVRMGPWNCGREPTKSDLAVAFYKRGKLLKEYSTADLVEDKSAVITSVTHYRWLALTDTALMLDPDNIFHIRTIDNIQYGFDITTGDIKSKKKPNTSDTSTGSATEAQGKVKHVYHLDAFRQLSVPEGNTRLSYACGKPTGGSYDTYFIVHDIETKAFLASPAWTPYSGKVAPLDVSKVAQLAKEYWHKNLEAYGEFEIRSIDLRCPRYRTSSDQSRWVYEVSFKHPINPIIVLLNETVVAATIVDLEQQRKSGVAPATGKSP